MAKYQEFIASIEEEVLELMMEKARNGDTQILKLLFTSIESIHTATQLAGEKVQVTNPRSVMSSIYGIK